MRAEGREGKRPKGLPQPGASQGSWPTPPSPPPSMQGALVQPVPPVPSWGRLTKDTGMASLPPMQCPTSCFQAGSMGPFWEALKQGQGIAWAPLAGSPTLWSYSSKVPRQAGVGGRDFRLRGEAATLGERLPTPNPLSLEKLSKMELVGEPPPPDF